MNIPHESDPEGVDLSFLDDGLLHAFNPFPIPDWTFAGFLILLLVLFVGSGLGIQIARERARDEEFEERADRLGYVKKDGAGEALDPEGGR